MSSNKIVSIIGYDRSGTTLLGKLLSKLNGIEYFGELDKVFHHKKELNGRICSCGLNADECEIWRKIAFDEIEKPQELYTNLSDILKLEILVESSKKIGFLENIIACWPETLIVHMIRNPKGVVYSRMKTRKRRVGRGDHPNMRVAKNFNLLLLYDAIEWCIINHRIEIFKKKNGNFMTIYYKELESKFQDLLKRIDAKERNLNLLFDETLSKHHVLYGNINRFKPVKMPILVDNSWKDGLTSSQKFMVDLITFPTRFLYKYQF